MPRNVWMKKIDSFQKEKIEDLNYYLNMSSQDRLETVQFLREQHEKINGINTHKSRKNYEELLELFNRHNVRYCIIGSFALAFHARSRYTKDLDILVEPSLQNARKILAALKDFGFGEPALSVQDFTEPGQIIQLGYEPVRIDIITSVEGVDFRKIWENRSSGKFGETIAFFIGLHDFIETKKKADRPQDRADLDILEKLTQ